MKTRSFGGSVVCRKPPLCVHPVPQLIIPEQPATVIFRERLPLFLKPAPTVLTQFSSQILFRGHVWIFLGCKQFFPTRAGVGFPVRVSHEVGKDDERN